MTYPEFATVIAYLAGAVGKPVARKQAEVYFDLLGDLPLPVFQFAAKRAIAESAYPVLPPIGVLRKLAVEAMDGNEGGATPAEAWELCRAAIVKFGYCREKAGLQSLPSTVRRAAECLGWQDLCDSDKPEIVRAQFQKAYETLVDRKRRLDLLPVSMRQALTQIGAMPSEIEFRGGNAH